MKFFISGGAGFIGSHFVDYLLSKKHLYIANNYLKTLARIKRIIKQ